MRGEILYRLFKQFRSSALTLAVFSSFAAIAADTTWNGGDGDWDVEDNWSAGVPTIEKSINVNNGGTINLGSEVRSAKSIDYTNTGADKSVTFKADAGGGLSIVNGGEICFAREGHGHVIFDSGDYTLNGMPYIGWWWNEGTATTYTGIVDVVSAAVTSTGNVLVGRDRGHGILNVKGGSFKTSSMFYIGQANASGEVHISSGYMESGAGNELYICDGPNSTGKVYVTGGALVNRDNWFCVGRANNAEYPGSYAYAYVEVDGGAISNIVTQTDRHFTVGTLGNSNCHSELQLKKGEIYASNYFYAGELHNAKVVVSGGTLRAGMGVCVGSSVPAGEEGLLVVKGGVIETDHVYKNTQGRIDLRGGTFKAIANKSNYFENCGELIISNGVVTIDTAGYDVTIVNNISGVGGITKTGSGKLTLSGTVSIDGAITLSEGTLVYNSQEYTTAQTVKAATARNSVAKAIWTNALKDGDLDDCGNWICYDSENNVVKGGVPDSGTDVTVPTSLMYDVVDDSPYSTYYPAASAFEAKSYKSLDVGNNGTWTGAGADNAWTTDENWNEGRKPATGTVTFNSLESGKNHTVNFGSSTVTRISSFVFNNGTNTAEKITFTADDTSSGVRMEEGSSGINIGNAADSFGSLVLDKGTYYFANDIGLGNSSGNKAWGRLEVNSDATVYTRNWLYAGRGAAGSGGDIYLNGGTIKTGYSYSNGGYVTGQEGKVVLGENASTTGRVYQASGNVNVTGDELHLGEGTGSYGYWQQTTGDVQSTSNIKLATGANSRGEWTQASGNTKCNYLELGWADGAFGKYTISGGTLTNGNNITVGYAAGAAGELNISGTADVYSTWHLRVGGAENVNNATGVVNQTGGKMTVGGSWQEFWLGNGNGSKGIYNLSENGVVEVIHNSKIGNASGSEGYLNVSGTAVFTSVNTMSVGGGSSDANNATGKVVQASGTVSITGDSQDLVLGQANGCLGEYEANGGTLLVSDEIILASGDTSKAKMTVDGGNVSAGSVIYVGQNGNAEMTVMRGTVTAGSYVTVGSNLSEGESATLTIEGGTIVTPYVTKGTYGQIVISGGTFKATGDQSDYFNGCGDIELAEGCTLTIDTDGHAVTIGNNILGDGNITKTGTGTLTLSSVSVKGVIAISDGTLVLNGKTYTSSDSPVGIGGVWTGAGDNDNWSTAANWYGTRVPTYGTATFGTVESGKRRTVYFGSETVTSMSSLVFNNGNSDDGVITLAATNGGGITLDGTGNFTVGEAANTKGRVIQESGTINAQGGKVILGNDNLSSGRFDQTGGSLTTTEAIYIGKGEKSKGEMSIGGTVSATGKIYLGCGNTATGIVSQATGSIVTTPDNIELGTVAGSYGEWTQTGGHTRNSYLNIGEHESAYGWYAISGGTLTNGNNITVGSVAGSAGRLDISGTADVYSSWHVRVGGAENVNNATGIVHQTGGKLVTGTWQGLWLGNGSGSKGEYYLSGDGSVFITGNFSSVANAAGSEGRLDVSDNASFTSSGTLCIGGVYTDNGSIDNATGVVNQAGGTVKVTGDWQNVYLGNGNGSVGTYNMSGGTLEVRTSSAQYHNGEIWIGFKPGATGTMNVSGDAFIQAFKVALCGGASSKGTLNLNGGLLETRYIYRENAEATTSVVNLNGGTIKPLLDGTSAPDFLQSSVTAYVKEGGLVVDTSVADGAYIGAALLHGGEAAMDGGLVKVGSGVLKLGSAGDTFNGPVVVSNGVLNVNKLAVNADREIKVKIGRSNSSAIYFTTVTRSNDAKLKVSPIIDPADLPYPGMKFMVLSGLGEAFTETSQFENAATGYSVTEDHNGNPETFDLYKYTWSIESGALYVTVDYNESAIAYATWKGGASGSLSDAANWICTTIGGTTLAWATPSAYTTILFTNDASSWALPDLSGFDYLGVMAKASNIVLSADADWSAYEVEFADGAKVDLNNHTLTLGTYYGGNTVGGAEFTDMHEDEDAENPTYGTLVLGANNGVMYGNGKVKFSGKLKVKVTGTDDTPFQATVANTHTGGWIFEGNNYDVVLRYDTYSMGTGPVVFNGNGGFSSYSKSDAGTLPGAHADKNFYELDVVRHIYVNGENNRHVTTIAGSYHEFFRYADFHGNGEMVMSGNNTTETADDPGCWTNFTGTITLENVTLLHWSDDWPTNVTFKLKKNGVLKAREANKTIGVKKVQIDFDANGDSAELAQWDPGTTWNIKELVEDPEYTGTLNVAGRMVFPESSTASLKLGTVIAISGTDESDVSNLTVTIAETPTTTTTLMTTTGTITGIPSYSAESWEIVPDLDSKALILQSTSADITAYLEGAVNTSTATLPNEWVTEHLTGAGKPYVDSRASAIAALRRGATAPNGIPYTWCYALGLSTTEANSKPRLASAATASGWALSAAGITVPDALKGTVKIKSEGCADPDFNGDKTYGGSVGYDADVIINTTDITSGVRYFRIVFDVAEESGE